MTLVYTEYNDGQFTKKTLEALSYAQAFSDKVIALTINVADPTPLARYGVSKIVKVTAPELSSFQAKPFAELLTQVAQREQVSLVAIHSLSPQGAHQALGDGEIYQ